MKQEHSFQAECLECNWESSSKNSHPNARRHAKAYNHKVKVSWIFTYIP